MTEKTVCLAATPDYLKGAFLTHYFFFDTVLGPYVSADVKLDAFLEYASLFCMTEKAWLEQTFSTINTRSFAKAADTNTFFMLCRTSAFYPDYFSPEEKFLISQKSNAMRIKNELFGPFGHLSLDRALIRLEANASGGDVDCIALLAFIQQHGILVEEDRAAALSRMRRVARWNHHCGLLMCMKYGPREETARYASALYAMMSTPASVEAFAHISAYYALPDDLVPCPIARALERAFNRQLFQRNKLDPNALKMLSSPVLDMDAKKKLLLLGNRDAALQSLPLNISRNTPFSPVYTLENSSPLSRPKETEQILLNLSMLDVRGSVSYKPLLLVCEDCYVLDSYKKLLLDTLSDRKHGTVDLSDPGRSPFAEGKENAVIGLLDKLGDAASVICLENVQEIPRERGRDFIKFLRHDYLQSYRFPAASVSFDLSGMLPLLFAVSDPCDEICEACDVVHLAPISGKEVRPILADMARAKARIFGLEELKLTEGALDLLADHSVREAERLLEQAVSLHRRDGHTVTLTEGSFSFSQGEKDYEPISFWGGKN